VPALLGVLGVDAAGVVEGLELPLPPPLLPPLLLWGLLPPPWPPSGS
jgi:hypothetical protein